MTSKDESTQGEEMIGKLIAATGRGPTANPEARQRIYAAVKTRWEETTRAAAARAGDHGSADQKATVRPDNVTVLRPRTTAGSAADKGSRMRWPLRTIGLAATVAAVALTLTWLQTSGPDAGLDGGRLASLAQVDGGLERIRDGRAATIAAASQDFDVRVGDGLRTAANGRAALRLDNGLLLRLNVGSEVRFRDANEVELMAGAIYIDSGSGVSSPPLEISTRLGTVEHVGTQYEVNLDAASLRIRVREGRVAYRGTAGEVTGVAGEQFEVDASGPGPRRAIAPDDAAWDWAVGLATLPPADEYRLDETLSWIARELGLTLDYANATTRQSATRQIVYGLEGLNPRETLELAMRAAELRAEIRGQTLYISD